MPLTCVSCHPAWESGRTRVGVSTTDGAETQGRPSSTEPEWGPRPDVYTPTPPFEHAEACPPRSLSRHHTLDGTCVPHVHRSPRRPPKILTCMGSQNRAQYRHTLVLKYLHRVLVTHRHIREGTHKGTAIQRQTGNPYIGSLWSP